MSREGMRCRAAIGQLDSRVGDLAYNVRRQADEAEKALAAGASLIVFPELSLTGYTLRDLAWEIAVDPAVSESLRPLRDLSRKISIATGLVESGPGHGLYNAAVFFEDGEVKHIHRKVYLPTYGMFEEGRYFSPGTDVRAFDSKHGRFGMLVCEDAWHLTIPYLLALDGAEALLCLTASPTRVGGDAKTLDNATVNHEHHRTYARLLNVYTLFSNRVGFEDGVNFWGGSVITAPDGEHLAAAELLREAQIVGELDSAEVRRARRFSRHFLDERPELVIRSLHRHLRNR
jgi:NAD+ synthase (glutamine-hydrolysing)